MDEVFSDEAGPAEPIAAFAVDPCRRGPCRQRCEALRHQAGRYPGQDIARSCGRQGARRVDVDRRPAVGRGNYGIGPLEKDGSATAFGRGAGTVDLARDVGQVGESWGNSPAWGVISTGPEMAANRVSGRSAKTVSASASRTAARPSARADSTAWRVLSFPPEPGPISTALRRRSARSRAKSPSPSQSATRISRLGTSVDRRGRRRSRDGHEARAGAARRQGSHSGRTSGIPASQDP